MLKKIVLPPLAALALVTSTAQAQPEAGGGAEIIQTIVDCRNAPDDAAQLACYRRAADALVRAETAGDIVLVNRDDARKVRRQAFGLSALKAPTGPLG